ncbi:hypothetical protein Nepgr_028675 [Nepenthes gracilis]|uniref:Uncharacterized protein n=1 Tax=Nepenthes gracilis TaxID=150966 RepID=A0AAD3Y2B8_NEPGR|nr:hypothetical protein Nepgr_028675 [Nepenthes gracilis]
MKDSGELIFWKNNYRKPDPNFIRRGRGRPPKTETLRSRPGPSTATARPKNQQVPSLGSGRPRGRPRKTPRPAFYGSNPEQDLGFPVLLKGHGSPRPRGRPPKVKSSQMGGDIGPNEHSTTNPNFTNSQTLIVELLLSLSPPADCFVLLLLWWLSSRPGLLAFICWK